MNQIEDALTPEQRTGVLVKADPSKPWVVWRYRKKQVDHIGIEQIRKLNDEWYCEDLMGWPEPVVFAVGDILADIAAGKPAPPIADAALASLTIDDWTKHSGKWIVPIDARHVLAVYRFVYDGTPSVMLREYHKKGGWQTRCYATIDEASALEIGRRIAAMR